MSTTKSQQQCSNSREAFRDLGKAMRQLSIPPPLVVDSRLEDLQICSKG